LSGNGYAKDREWSDRYLPTIRRIVGPHLLEPAPLEEDNLHATDLIMLKARDKRIACRVRRPGFVERFGFEFTIRVERVSGAQTEMAKLINGFGDWMFYGHAAAEEGILGIERWLIADLAAWRAHLIRHGFQKLGKKMPNKDNATFFMAFDVRDFVGEPKLLVASSFDDELTRRGNGKIADFDQPPLFD
jgi:hypothetical protein